MFSRLRTIISKAPLAVFFLKDRWFRVIFYVLFVSLIAILPMTFKQVVGNDTQKSRLDSFQTALSHLTISQIKIENYQLTYQNDADARVDFFRFVVGDKPHTMNAVHIVFANEGIKVVIAGQVINEATYFSLGINDIDFTKMTRSENRFIAFQINELLRDIPIVFAIDLVGQYMVVLIDYLFIALMLALMSSLFFLNVKIPFADRFKLSLYLTTMYVLSQFFLTLIGYEQLSFISIIIVYIYHVWTYRSIRLVPRGESK